MTSHFKPYLGFDQEEKEEGWIGSENSCKTHGK
jgi:hypothetical protein